MQPAEVFTLVPLVGDAISLHVPVGKGVTPLEDVLAHKAALQPLDAVMRRERADRVRHALARLDPREACAPSSLRP
jgi:DNA-directed RNA polymerase sigma subunit (sigma70/sigma32)